MEIRHDPRNRTAVELREELEPALAERGLDEALPEDLCLVLGGDGFLLRVIAEGGAGPLYLGLNCGRMGFMMNDVQSLQRVLERLAQPEQWSALEVHRLRASWEGPEGERAEALAVNDVYLERASGQTAHLRVCVDGNEVVRRLVCDGVIAATALGSTAYALAAGGAASHVSLPLIQMVAINPHIPRLPPIALPRSATIEVEVIDGHRRPVRVVADGRDLAEVSAVRIRGAEQPVRLAYLEGHDPTVTLIRKLLHP